MSHKQNDILIETAREDIIEELTKDYYYYLSDMSLVQLRKIVDNNVFTLREARRMEENGYI